MSYYQISIKDIKNKLASKKRIKPRITDNLFNKFNNVKNITNEYGETLTRIDGDIPIDLDIEDGQRFLFISYDQSKYSHGIHKYPAKFFPELPRWLIRRYSKAHDLILDPFMGSATTNIEALLNERNSIGIDIDPFAKLLAKVKTTPLDIDELEQISDELFKRILSFNPESVLFNEVPDFPYRDNWFTKDILHELAHIRKSILDLTYDVQDIRDFLLITMSSIIRTVSNADDHCTRTVVRKRLKKEIYPSMALKKFVEALIMNTHRINEYSRDLSGNNFVDITENSDARFIDFPDNNFDLAITSPPYVNAVDYTRTHQLEIYWLGLAKGSLTPLKQVHVGTEVVKVNDYNNLFNIGDKEADKVIEEIFLKDKRRAYIAYKYLYDMKLNLIEVYRTLKPGARYIIVVGNNKIKGYLFENWKYLMNIASQIGYKIENYFASEIIKHFIKVPREERINTDWIIVLRK